MREIMFRGKRLDNGEWVEGTYLHLNVGKDYICDGTVWIGTLQPCKIEVDPETVGQYTGLTDKNGVKIFEGDIVEVVTLDTNEVRRTAIGIGMCEETGDDVPVMGVYCDYFEKPYVFPADKGEYVEIIGNIHDNPELLKEGGE